MLRREIAGVKKKENGLNFMMGRKWREKLSTSSTGWV